MDPIEKGKWNEERGLATLRDLKKRYPNFVLKVRRSPPAVDARGMDSLVEIELPAGLKKPDMTVPIEFKSSPSGVAKWKIAHRNLYKAGVLIFYFPDEMTPRQMRLLMYRALKSVQLNSKDGTLYHSMFQRLFKGGSRKLWRNIALIKKERSREKRSSR